MGKKLNYRHTIWACYFGNFFQTVGAVFAVLFIPLRTLYGLSYTQFAVLIGINFFTQVTSDVLFSKAVEKYGFRKFSVIAPLVSAAGILLFALAPILFPGAIFVGLCVAMFIFAAAGGLQELLLSPILDSVPMPEEKKAKSMSALHSCFAWGQIFSVLVTSLLVYFLKAEYWQWIAAIWAIPPIISSFLFAVVPLQQKVSHSQSMKIGELFKSKVFLLVLFAIIAGGASEVVMSQWASAFIERGLALPKILGDMIGVCGFSLMLAIGRTGYGIIGDKLSIHKVMTVGSVLAVFLYGIAAVSGNPYVGIAACVLTGLSVSMLWPGSIIIASKHLPLAGASMFALLSAGGDIGATSGSFVIGQLADAVGKGGASSWLFIQAETPEQLGLRIGLLGAAIFPLIGIFINIALSKRVKKG